MSKETPPNAFALIASILAEDFRNEREKAEARRRDLMEEREKAEVEEEARWQRWYADQPDLHVKARMVERARKVVAVRERLATDARLAARLRAELFETLGEVSIAPLRAGQSAQDGGDRIDIGPLTPIGHDVELRYGPMQRYVRLPLEERPDSYVTQFPLDEETGKALARLLAALGPGDGPAHLVLARKNIAANRSHADLEILLFELGKGVR